MQVTAAIASVQIVYYSLRPTGDKFSFLRCSTLYDIFLIIETSFS